MCGIFGVLSYKNKLKDMDELVNSLAEESAERGTDATGIAYVSSGKIKINKQAVSAYHFKPNVPKFINAVIGHTRHSTQGDKSKNYNNHPWSETVKNCQFALAHNGVLLNDAEIQKKYKFKSRIQTDSFVAVQLLKMKNILDFDSIKFMAEEIDGSFSFNILDNKNNIYLVKGDSPISILHFRKIGVYVFASTERILWRALIDSELFDDLQAGNYEQIELKEGDILKITSNGKTEKGRFNYTYSSSPHWYDFGYSYTYDEKDVYGEQYLEDIKSVAAMYGEDPEVIQELYEQGFSLEELEDIIYCGSEV